MAQHQRFSNRIAAGELLASRLASYANRQDVTVLALPRGGVPVGHAVAHALCLPLDVLIVRKLGTPGHREYAMGAIASGGLSVLNQEVVQLLNIPQPQIEEAMRRESVELSRREKLYRGNRPKLNLHGRTVILVDDGLATGATMQVAIRAVRTADPERIVVATPVSAPETCRFLSSLADEMVCLATPDPFHAVGLWYDDFRQTSDAEVIDLLEQAEREHSQPCASSLPKPSAHTQQAAP